MWSLIFGRVQQKGEAGVGCQRYEALTDGWNGLAVQAERSGSLASAIPGKPPGSVKPN